jgi:hypothetical protein
MAGLTKENTAIQGIALCVHQSAVGLELQCCRTSEIHRGIAAERIGTVGYTTKQLKLAFVCQQDGTQDRSPIRHIMPNQLYLVVSEKPHLNIPALRDGQLSASAQLGDGLIHGLIGPHTGQDAIYVQDRKSAQRQNESHHYAEFHQTEAGLLIESSNHGFPHTVHTWGTCLGHQSSVSERPIVTYVTSLIFFAHRGESLLLFCQPIIS